MKLCALLISTSTSNGGGSCPPDDHLGGDDVSDRKRVATLQAVAAMAGAELTQTKAGAFVVKRGDYSAHCKEIEAAAQAVHRMAGTARMTEATA